MAKCRPTFNVKTLTVGFRPPPANNPIRGERRNGEVLLTTDGAPVDWRTTLAVREPLADGSSSAEARGRPRRARAFLPPSGSTEMTSSAWYGSVWYTRRTAMEL